MTGFIEFLTLSQAPAMREVHSTSLMTGLLLFALGAFIGTGLAEKLPQILHSVWLSLGSVLAGAVIIAAMLAAGAGRGLWSPMLAFLALVAATAGVVGGSLVLWRQINRFPRP